MNISPILIYNTTFTSNTRVIQRSEVPKKELEDKYTPLFKNKVGFYSNATFFYRNDLSLRDVDGCWNDFRRVITEEFKNAPKVNVYNFACSDGSETYSLVMSLLEGLDKKEAEKYFPIRAFDLDPIILDEAKSGEIPCNREDIDNIKTNVKDVSKYCSFVENPSHVYPYKFMAHENIKSLVDFKQGDFTKLIEDINPDNSLIMCRNFWYYLGERNIVPTFDKLAKKVNNSSVLVIGDFDRGYLLPSLHKHGFKEISHNVFKKTDDIPKEPYYFKAMFD